MFPFVFSFANKVIRDFNSWKNFLTGLWEQILK